MRDIVPSAHVYWIWNMIQRPSSLCSYCRRLDALDWLEPVYAFRRSPFAIAIEREHEHEHEPDREHPHGHSLDYACVPCRATRIGTLALLHTHDAQPRAYASARIPAPAHAFPHTSASAPAP